MIEVKNLTKRYGAKKAVDNISFTVNDGEILGFLGPNGAGKSTTMNIITGYSGSTDGTVTVDGKEILDDPVGVKSKIGYLPEQPPLYLDMTVKEYLSFMFDLKKVSLPKEAHIKEICEHVQITDVYGRIIKNLSKGYRQRVGLAQALLGNPSVLILDEPTVGLDPKQIIEIRNLIKGLGQKYTIILSSHILPEVQATCERVIVINKGKIIADGTTDKLSQTMSGEHHLTVRIDGPEAGVLKLLNGIPQMLRVDKLGARGDDGFDYTLEAEPGVDIRRELFFRLAERGWPILGLRGSELTLEEIFLQLTDENANISLNDDGEPAPETPETVEGVSEAELSTEQESDSEPERLSEPESEPERDAPETNGGDEE